MNPTCCVRTLVTLVTGCMTVSHDFVDRWLAKTWVKLSSQHINYDSLDVQCKTLMITSWSAKGIDTQNAWVVSKLVQEAERPTRHNSKKNTTAGLMRIEMTARALFERPTEVKYTEPGSSKISLMKRQESSHTNPCKNSRVSNAAAYQPTLLWPVETLRRSVRQYPSHAIW